MKLVVFGLSVTSSWGNGHATLWRGLLRALDAHGHRVVFFERDVPYYASHRDYDAIPGGELILYTDWDQARAIAVRQLDDADAAMVTSYCPDGIAAGDLVLSSRSAVKAFYDLDTPVTLANLEAGRKVDYIGPRGLADFDVALSFTGGAALVELTTPAWARGEWRRSMAVWTRPCTIRFPRGASTTPACHTLAHTPKTARPHSRNCCSSPRGACRSAAS